MVPVRYPAALALFAVASCGVATPARVTTLQPAMAPAALAFDAPGPEDTPASALASQFRSSLATELGARSVAVEADSRYRLAIGFALRPADAGVGQIDGANIAWSSEPRRHRWYHACRARRVEVVVALRDAASGAVTGKWRGGFDDCRPSEAQVTELAGQVARAITGR